MKLIFKYAKPFTAMILLSIVLLFGQAITDLWLPNYMSTIVNVGLQQGGIEESVPAAMSDDAMALVLRFIPAPEREAFRATYTYSETAIPESLTERLPLLEENGGWVRTGEETAGTGQTELYQRAMLALSYYAQGQLGAGAVSYTHLGCVLG